MINKERFCESTSIGQDDLKKSYKIEKIRYEVVQKLFK
ncbi:hypothetical protein DFQ07_2567 [Tenacibaculum caenipelagi]|uniref:Uncharacterized protein n=1 Tax=Tenacibaculum caenipelagi TaxID=1325435 RepID=A0A4R6TE24_9FLAO|nr:hypothetical protein DFQ07_2567 [Tenacibaculum caenipelagi]